MSISPRRSSRIWGIAKIDSLNDNIDNDHDHDYNDNDHDNDNDNDDNDSDDYDDNDEKITIASLLHGAAAEFAAFEKLTACQ